MMNAEEATVCPFPSDCITEKLVASLLNRWIQSIRLRLGGAAGKAPEQQSDTCLPIETIRE